MHIVSVLLFVISASLDNLIVGIAYGIKKLKIPLSSNLIIAFISCIGTFISMLLGKFLGNFMSYRNSNIIGSSILIFIGLYFIIKSYKRDNGNISLEKKLLSNESKAEYSNQYEEILIKPEKADKDNSGNIDFKEALTLGLALALNNIGLGIGASITGLSISLTCSLTLIFSLTAIPLGFIIGKKFLSSILENKAEIISGIIIILLGVYELFI